MNLFICNIWLNQIIAVNYMILPNKKYLINEYRLFAFFVILIIFTGHSFAKQSSSDDLCKIKDAKTFLSRFSEDIYSQKNSTWFPLRYSFLHPTDSDYEERSILVEKMTDLKFYFASQGFLFPNRAQRNRFYLKFDTKIENREMIVKLYGPNTDNMTYYYFRKFDDCWKLFRIDSKSM